MQHARGIAKPDRSQRAAEADDSRPGERHLQIARLRDLGEPDPPLQPAEKAEMKRPRAARRMIGRHANDVSASGARVNPMSQRGIFTAPDLGLQGETRLQAPFPAVCLIQRIDFDERDTCAPVCSPHDRGITRSVCRQGGDHGGFAIVLRRNLGGRDFVFLPARAPAMDRAWIQPLPLLRKSLAFFLPGKKTCSAIARPCNIATAPLPMPTSSYSAACRRNSARPQVTSSSAHSFTSTDTTQQVIRKVL